MVSDIDQDRLLQSARPAVLLSIMAGLCSCFGGLVGMLLLRSRSDLAALKNLSLWQAAVAGILLFWSCSDILPEAAAGITLPRASGAFAAGIGIMWLVSRRIWTDIARAASSRSIAAGHGGGSGQGATANAAAPASEPPGTPTARDEVLACGLVCFVCIALHNFFEGIAICLASYVGLDKGLPMAVAIGIENVPEGVVIALPVYYATQDVKRVFKMTLMAGLIEPLGVLAVPVFLRHQLSSELVSLGLAGIAGMLVFLCAHEILPLAVKHVGLSRIAPLSIALGAGIMSASMLQPMLIFHGRVGRVS